MVNLIVNFYLIVICVVSVFIINRQGDYNKLLVLDGDKLMFKFLLLNKNDFLDFIFSDEGFIINIDEDMFELEIYIEIDFKNNKVFEGLYLFGGVYCMQCEVEGFCCIIYFMD